MSQNCGVTPRGHETRKIEKRPQADMTYTKIKSYVIFIKRFCAYGE